MRLVLLLFLLGVGFAASDATEAGYVTGLIVVFYMFSGVFLGVPGM